jgi:hypothetical protein
MEDSVVCKSGRKQKQKTVGRYLEIPLYISMFRKTLYYLAGREKHTKKNVRTKK